MYHEISIFQPFRNDKAERMLHISTITYEILTFDNSSYYSNGNLLLYKWCMYK